MEGMVITQPSTTGLRLSVKGRRILVTGHTGFKGAWLSEWLLRAGAKVAGLALPPESPQALFAALGLDRRMDHQVGDVRDSAKVTAQVREADPELIFHLAAQALVRRSYRDPLGTWSTNVLGTLNVLEAARALGRRVTVVVVTTDKVYSNREWEYAYREEDPLGGHDPYSSSKAACEIAVASWRASFGIATGVTVVTARAGNVIGAGDVSEDRIVPDCYRAWNRGETVQLRNPASTRPWQHVLEPLSGYFFMAAQAEKPGPPLIETCNFGPGPAGDHSVEVLVRALAASMPSRKWAATATGNLHEARALSLSIERARHRLGWTPRLSFAETVQWTDAGYVKGASLPEVVTQQIAAFESRGAVLV